MKILNKILKVGALAIVACVIIGNGVFAADDCIGNKTTYPNVEVVESTSSPTTFSLKCMAATFTYNSKTYDIYAKSSVDCASASQISQNPAGFCENNTDVNNIIQTAINIIIWFVGILSVIIIIVGGILYSTSLGDPGKVKKAKDTIMYGIVGLVIAILAFAIVRFILGMFSQ